MCGRIEACLLIGVELVREGCGLSFNRTQKREGGSCLDHCSIQYEADVTNSGTEYKGSSQISRCQNVLEALQMTRRFTRNGT